MQAYAVSFGHVAAFYLEMCGEQGFKAVHKTVHLVKCIGKGCSFFFFFFFFECLCYATWYLQNIKYWDFYLSTWPHNNITSLHNFRFVLMSMCFSA